jgi:phosphoenolpyruvate synthase/pyruvate phosphate dikinase
MTVAEHGAWLEALGLADVARVGGKNASRGEMIRALTDDGVRCTVNVRQQRRSP